MVVAPQHVAQEALFQHVGGAKVGMATLGSVGIVTLAVPGQVGFAQPRARCDDRDRCAVGLLSVVQRVYFSGLQKGYRVSNCLKVVDQINPRDGGDFLKAAGADHPGQVGDRCLAARYRSGNAEDRPLHRHGDTLQEFVDNGLEVRIGVTGKDPFLDG